MATQIKNGAAGSITEAYVATGTLLLSDNLMWGKVFLRQDERDFLNFMETNQNWAVSDGSTIRWHEQSYISNNAKIASFTGGASVGASATITIAAADHYVSGTRSPFTKNQTIKVGRYDLFIQSKNETVANAHTMTVYGIGSTSSAIALNTVLAAGQTMVPIGSQYAQQTDFDKGETSLPTEFEESLGIFKTSIKVSGTEATNKNKVTDPYNGSYYVTYQADTQCFIKHKLQISYQLLVGSGGTATDSDGNTVTVAKGLEKQIRERGTVYNYNSTVTLGDLYNWTRILLNERAPYEQLVQAGHEANIMLEQVMTETMKQGAKIYLDNSKNGDGSKLIDFGFDAFKMTDFMFFKKPFVEFNHPVITYAAGQPYPHMIMITPHTKVRDAKTGQSGYTMQLGYKSAQGPKGTVFDRKFQSKILGLNAPTPTNGVDEVQFTYLTECGVALACANQAIIVDRSDI
jgi:hypothetical protein